MWKHKPGAGESDVLFALVRGGLWHDSACLPAGLCGDEAFWGRVLHLARSQTVTGLAWRGLELLPDDALPPDGVLMRWAAAADAVERENRKMNMALGELYAMFRKDGLNPVLQKGQGLADFYEEPLLRECGDIDLYFPDRTDAARAASLVSSAGARVCSMPDGSCHYTWRGVVVEHHPRLMDIYNPFAGKYIGRLERELGFSEVTLQCAGMAGVAVPSPLLNLLLVNTHIMKHAMGWGVGLRQLCDMARACFCLKGQFDSSEMRHVCRKLGIDRWSRLLHAFLADVMGLDAEYLPYPDRSSTCRPLLDIVIKGGNFGMHSPGRGVRAGVLKRKLLTMSSFLGNVGFSLQYSPRESFWTFASLVSGQLRK